MRRWRQALIGVTALFTIYPGGAVATFLQAPHSPGCDAGMAGNAVAGPCDGAATLLWNAAGIVNQPTEVTAGIIVLNISGRYTNSAIGFDQRSSEGGMAPAFWLGTDRWSPWYVGAGLYGAIGSSFNFGGDPHIGIPNRFKAEMSILQLGFVVGREITPGLRVGVQVSPMYGSLVTRTPTPLGPLAFDVGGIGISGAVGLLYDLNPETTLGLSYRGRGIVFMSDDDARVGSLSEEVDIDLRTPDSVVFGVARALGPNLKLFAQGTWTNYPQFEKGVFEFKRNPALNQRFISDARSTFRYGAGLEYAVSEWARLRAGATREEWMMEGSSLSPLLYDTSDVMPMVGGEIDSGSWTYSFDIGWMFTEDRQVTAQDQVNFPGRYRLRNLIGGGMAVTYRFGKAS